jgi:RHS repeat-associated protein
VDGQFVGGHMTGGQTIDLTILGRDGMPIMSGVSAVALNVTVTNSQAAAYLVVYPSGGTLPNASNLNFVANQAISNQVIVPIGANGKVSVYLNNTTTSADVIADVAGYFPSASAFTPLTPARLLDTRIGGVPVGPGGQLNLTVLGAGGVPSSGVSAVVVNVTATNPTAASFITVWPAGSSRPTNASNLNVVAGQTIPNLVMVGVGTSGQISFYNNAGSTDLIADVVGYFPSTAPAFDSLVPARLLDTRAGGATVDGQFVGTGALTPTNSPLNLTVLGRGNVPTSGVGAVALNITAVTPSATGFITAWGKSTTGSTNPTPLAMQLNFTAGSIIPSLVIAQVGANGQVSLANSAGSTDVVADVVGWFPGPPLAPASVTATSTGGGAVTVNWTLNSSGTTPTYLQIQRATNSAGPWTLINGNYTPATSGQITDLVFADTTYYYEVAACNLAGCSAYTPSTGTPVSTIPGAPTSSQPSVVLTPATDPKSDVIGATLAQFRVDEAGNATYSVPIQVPPGTAGVTPKMALSYNSRLPNGVMGPGWTIEGSSQIARCRQTRESGDFVSSPTPDGDPPTVNFSATDRFCLDGVRLLLRSGNTGAYGDTNTTYSPETDPTTLVTATVVTGTVGPSSFKVQRKDGTTSTYGSIASSPNALVTASLNNTTVAVSWNLARVQDSVGNYIDYLYTPRSPSDPNLFVRTAVETTLAQVKYTGHATSPVSIPYASVTFTYTTLPLTQMRIGYQGGVTFVQTQQLTSVAVTDGSNTTNPTLRYYWLTYGTSLSGSQFQQLQKLQECRDSTVPTNPAAVCYPPTLFTWSGAQTVFQNGTTQSLSTSGAPNFKQMAGYKVADVDGDGRQDFVWAVNGDSACPNGSAIYVGFLDRTTGGDMTVTTAGQIPKCATINLSGNDRAWYLVDFDGDGRADLLIGGGTGSNWAVYSSLGRPTTSGIAVFSTTNLLAGLATPITVPTGMTAAAGILADVNGDGLPDLITPNTAGPINPTSGINNRADSGLSVRLMVRSGSTFTFSNPYSIILTFAPGDTTCAPASNVQCSINFFNTNTQNGSVIPTDVNGDGRADLMFLLQTTPCSPCQQAPASALPRLHFDPNLGMPNNGQTPATPGTSSYYWFQFTADGISTPTGFPQAVQLMQQYIRLDTTGDLTLPRTIGAMFAVDLTGDGLPDILYQDASTSTTYHVLINIGTGYQGAAVTVLNISNGAFLQFADINADGKTDLVYPAGSSPFTAYNYQSLVPVNTTNGWSFMTTAGTVSGTGLHNDTNWKVLIGDFDGDGAPDFLSVQTVATTANLYTSRAAASSRYHPRDVITDIFNGLGAATHVLYQPLTNIGIYRRGGASGYPAVVTASDYGWSSPVFDVLAPLYVVSQASSNAPTRSDPNALSTVYYRYAGATMQAGGRGFLGFYENWSFDTNDSLTTTQYVATLNHYAQRYPLMGMPTGTLKQVFNGTTVDRQSPLLNACAANIEDASNNCFPGITGPASLPVVPTWPTLTSGKWISLGLQVPICAGPGCQVSAMAAQCLAGGGTLPPSTSNPFIGPTIPGPVFGYVAWTSDTQYDITSPTNAANAGTGSFFCYDGNGTGAGLGNLINSRTLTQDGSSPAVTVADKATSNTFTNDTSNWFLGRMTQSQVQFTRPGQSTKTRTTNYTYDSTSGLLTSEQIQSILSGGTADQDLRTLYDLDAYGNRIAAYQCSAQANGTTLTDAQCRAHSGANQQQSGTTVLRYAKTAYDSSGRYSTGSSLPFYSSTATGGWNEQEAVSVAGRDEFGNVIDQIAINGLEQIARFGVLGRPYFAKDSTGKASTTTYRLCTGANQVSCGGDARLIFRSQTAPVGAPASWTYFDVLGRPVVQVTQSFDSNSTNNQFSAVCTYNDGHNRPIFRSEPVFAPATIGGDGSPSFTAAPCSGATIGTSSIYDVLGRVTQIIQPDTSTINKTYVGLVTTASNPRNAAWTWSETRNPLGEIVTTQDPTVTGDTTVGLTVTQTYDAMGDVRTIARDAGSGTITSSYSYDDLGRKIAQTDPDSGNAAFTYNAAGDVITQTDNHVPAQTLTQNYDALGRKWQRTTSNAADGNNLTDSWTYDAVTVNGVTVNGFGQLTSESRSGTSSSSVVFARSMTFDAYGRSRTRTTTIGMTAYTESTAYDANGRVKAQQDASGYNVAPNYSATTGYTLSLTDSRIGTLYQVLSMTARGQVASDRRGATTALNSALTYDPNTGRLSTVCSGSGSTCNLQDLQYLFDVAGNLTTRTRAFHGASTAETFTYDALNRLTAAQLVKIQGSVPTPYPTLSLTYDKLGNICTKMPINSSAITYTYAGLAGCSHNTLGSPHAVISAGGVMYGYDADGNQISSSGMPGRAISYNALNQVTQSIEAGVTVKFQYGPDGDRFVRTDTDTGITTYYVGKTEIRAAGNSAEVRRYLGGVAIDYVRSSGSNETRYTFGDHLGSMDVIASNTGTVLESQSFDAHGSRRDPTVWNGSAPEPTDTNVGFTGQEHVDSQSFIHMNGRIYDPQLGRMLQADPLMGPGTQGLNRYAYVVNNPLTLTDPTGYSWLSNLLHFSDNLTGRLALGPFYDQYHGQWNSFITDPYVRTAGAIVAGYFTFGASYAALGEGFWAGVGAGAASGFVAGTIQTQSLQGALQGAFSGAIAGGVYGYYGETQSLQRVGVETIAGGAESKIEGGNFVEGMKFAFTVAILNYSNYRMRQYEIRESMQHYYNSDGVSSGLFDDGFKLAGARREGDPYDSLYQDPVHAPAGGVQGLPVNPGDDLPRLGPFIYSPNSSLDYIAESFAGPHDWLRDMTGSYDPTGNSYHFDGRRARLDSVLNYAEIPIAAPFSIGALIHETPGVYLPLQQCYISRDCK